MRDRGAMLVAVLMAATALGCAPRRPLVLPGVSARDAVRLAHAEAMAGRHREALGWYEQVLATSGVEEKERRQALRGAAMLRMSPDPALRHLARSQTLLTELTAMKPAPEVDDRGYELSMVLTLLTDLDRAGVDASTREAELGRAIAATAAVNRSLDDARKQALDADSVAEAEIAQLRAQERARQRDMASLRTRSEALEAELIAARVEIQKRDAALRKVAATLGGTRTTP